MVRVVNSACERLVQMYGNLVVILMGRARSSGTTITGLLDADDSNDVATIAATSAAVAASSITVTALNASLDCRTNVAVTVMA